MKTATAHSSQAHRGSVAADVGRGMLGLAWHVVRLPVLAFLVILEPIVRLVLWGAAFLIERILEHLGHTTEPVDPANPSRAPPQGDLLI